MATVSLKGTTVLTSGALPQVGTVAPDFKLVKADLSETGLSAYNGKRKVLNIFPSVDTGTCAMSVRKFNESAAGLKNTVVLCISRDLPFALNRFCGAEKISNVETLSGFRSEFGKLYGVDLLDSPLKGLYARAVVVLDEQNKVLHTELVTEIVTEPNYQNALSALA